MISRYPPELAQPDGHFPLAVAFDDHMRVTPMLFLPYFDGK